MEKYRLIVVFFLLIVWSVSSVPRRERNKTIQSFDKKTGEAIAVNDLLQIYEKEHQKLYQEETKNGGILDWPALENGNLSTYCGKYLQHSVPAKTTDDAIGFKIVRTLCYQKENTNIMSKIVIVKCKVIKCGIRHYYMTRAPESNCVYALKGTKYIKNLIFTIIYKYCDFEDKPLKSISLKQKRIERVSKIDRRTGQPVANDKYLWEYELAHWEMARRNDGQGEYIEWPYIMAHNNLDSYCYQYMRECIPTRNREGIKGSLKTEKLQYQKLYSKKHMNVTTVTCQTPNIFARRYYLTRAPETNCVYALLKQSSHSHNPLVIIFKHCDFEDPNDEQAILQEHNNFDKNVIIKTEVKEEILDTLQTLQLYPKD